GFDVIHDRVVPNVRHVRVLGTVEWDRQFVGHAAVEDAKFRVRVVGCRVELDDRAGREPDDGEPVRHVRLLVLPLTPHLIHALVVPRREGNVATVAGPVVRVLHRDQVGGQRVLRRAGDEGDRVGGLEVAGGAPEVTGSLVDPADQHVVGPLGSGGLIEHVANLRDEFARGGHGGGLLELHGGTRTESDDGEGSLDVGRRVEQDAGGAGNVGDGDADRHHHVSLGCDPNPAVSEYASFEIDVRDTAG